MVTVQSPERLWWRRLVYKRRTPDGYDLIVHLVRIPPTKDWDIHWVDEPAPLGDVRVMARLGNGRAYRVVACRPYHFEEPQQVVERTLDMAAKSGQVTGTIPAFRYHTMVVIRVATR